MATNTAFSKGFFRDNGLDYQARGVLGRAVHGGSDAGEVLATFERISDHDTWRSAWAATATRVATRSPATASARAATGCPAPWPSSTAWRRPSPTRASWTCRPPGPGRSARACAGCSIRVTGRPSTAT
ncbi:MAG TPA: hypothetical protein VK659_17630 [Asanoa sp.]|nr:hypothetical protein [Asanoa sp.]